MGLRVPLVTAVIGALLVAGATTGTTYASWVDQAPLHQSGVGSAAMSLGASDAPASTLLAPGATTTVPVTVTDTSSGAAKNLVQRVTATASVPTGVTVALTRDTGSGCPGSAFTSRDTQPGGSFVLCVRLTAAATASSGTVQVVLTGRQVQGSVVQGWTTSRTVSLPVAVVPNAPVLSCQGSTLSWTATGSTYRVQARDNGSEAWEPFTNTSETSARATGIGIYGSRQFRVVAVTGGVESDPSNAVRINRLILSYSCEVL